VRDHFPEGTYSISPMVDSVAEVVLWANLLAAPGPDILLEGYYLPPKGLSWREGMRTPPRTWKGSAVRVLLSHLLSSESYEDLCGPEGLVELYPDHVIEFSILSRCLGTVPGRNAVVWEVRYNY
jgi:hypothetical protein